MEIEDLQLLMRRLYFAKDSNRGARGTYNLMVDEVREHDEAIDRKDKKELEREFADVIAWLASLANITEVDLAEAALAKYGNGCPKCGSSPCRCANLG